MTVEFTNNFRLVRGQLNDKMHTNVRKAAMYLEGEVKRAIGSGKKSGKTYPVPGTNRTYTASAPGETPAVMMSDYMNSITHAVKSSTNEITGTVGTNMAQAKRLEFGFVGTDKKGRKYNQAPRPHLKVTYEKHREKIRKILSERVNF